MANISTDIVIFEGVSGCVPVLTLNYQKRHPEASPRAQVSDSWHHQAIIGVEKSKVFLTNPADEVHVATLQYYLCSDSKLLVQWQDVWSRYDDDTNLTLITQHPNQDPRWIDYNVLGKPSILRLIQNLPKNLFFLATLFCSKNCLK